MSYELLASKRKFHRLLDQISGPQLTLGPVIAEADDHDGSARLSVTGDNVPGTHEPPAKRRRLQPSLPKSSSLRERSSFIKASPHLALLLAQQARAKQIPSEARTREELEEMLGGSYKPSSQAAFLSRLGSFSSVTEWLPKPEAMNEVKWAKRGWRLVAPETVCCDTCQSLVVVEMTGPPPPAVQEQEGASTDLAKEKLAIRYSDKIVQSHGNGCPWKQFGCNDSVYRVTMFPEKDSIQRLLGRYKHFISRQELLPKRIVTDVDNLDLDLAFHALLTLFPKEAEGVNVSTEALAPLDEDAEPKDSRFRALALALAGWDINPITGDSKYMFASCEMCFRRVGLWLFNSSRSSSDSDDQDAFELAEQHRDHCPWKDSSSQCPVPSSLVESKNATQLLFNALFRAAVSKIRQHEGQIGTIEGELPLHHPSRNAIEQAEQVHSSRTSQTDSLDTEKTDQERKEKLRGLKKFFGRLKDIGSGRGRVVTKESG